MRSLSILLATVLVPILTSSAIGAPPPSRIMALVNKHLPGITIYDADTLKPVCQATTGIAPHEVALSADGRFAYVPVYGSSGVGKPGTDEHMFHIFQTSDCKQVAAIDTGEYKRPHCVLVGKSGTVYVTAEIAAAVILIDPKTQKIIGEIPTGSHTSHMIALSPDESRIYSSNVQSKTVSVLDVKARKLIATVPTGSENQRITISPDGKWFVTSLGPESKIAFFRTSDNQLDFTIPVEGTPFVAKFSADGRFLFDAGTHNHQIAAWKIDVNNRKVIATSSEDLGHDPGSLEVDPFDGNVLISDQPSNKVTVLDPASWKTVKTIATAQTPDAMAFAVVR